MRLRAPALPLITVDPYFSVWSPSEKLTDSVTMHWTGKPNTIVGTATIDGVACRFLGKLFAKDDSPVMEQVASDCTATATTYVFRAANVELRAEFMTPVLAEDLTLVSRPVSYLKVCARSLDGVMHSVAVKIAVSEES